MSSSNENNPIYEIPLANVSDINILMHRDAHFSGNFDIMLEYYRKGGKGVSPDIDIDRIEELAAIEKNMGINLAPLLFSAPDAEKVARAKDSYKKLRDVYGISNPKTIYPKLIADLILSEDEEEEREIDAVVAQKGGIVPALIELVKSDEFHDPLFPGYGLAPVLAAKALGMIGDKRAVISLFESLGEGDLFDEDIIIEALRQIGDPAKQFLLRVLHGIPVTEDNEKAAIALIHFKDDPDIAKECLNMLIKPDVRSHTTLSTYLILACAGLPDQDDRDTFNKLLDDPHTPKLLKQDIQTVLNEWKTLE